MAQNVQESPTQADKQPGKLALQIHSLHMKINSLTRRDCFPALTIEAKISRRARQLRVPQITGRQDVQQSEIFLLLLTNRISGHLATLTVRNQTLWGGVYTIVQEPTSTVLVGSVYTCGDNGVAGPSITSGGYGQGKGKRELAVRSHALSG